MTNIVRTVRVSCSDTRTAIVGVAFAVGNGNLIETFGCPNDNKTLTTASVAKELHLCDLWGFVSGFLSVFR